MLKSTFSFLLAFVLFITYNCLIDLFPVLEKGKVCFTVLLCIAAAIVAIVDVVVLIKKIMGYKTAGLFSVGLSTVFIVAFWVAILLSRSSFPFLESYRAYAMIAAIVAMAVFAACAVTDLISAFVRKK